MTIPVRRGHEVKAARGPGLRCKGWRQEAILRLLENNLENAEDPDNLVIYMSIARAARDWNSFDRIVATLSTMREDQTFVVQSGKPIGVFPGQSTTPLVIMANGNIVGEWSNEESRRKLDDKGLTIMPGMTAGAWQYIGSQGILQGTYETFMAAARAHFGGTLAGRLLLTSGCGGMSGAQPLAGKLAGASTLVVEVDQARIARRIASGYCDASTDSLDQAIQMWLAARDERRPLALALCGNAAAVLPEIAARGILPDIVTDQTFPDPLKGYVPVELSVEQARILRNGDPDRLITMARHSVAAHVRAMLDFLKRGSIVFEYGNELRAEAQRAGVEDAFTMRSFVDLYIRPLFCQGIGPFRWIAVSGNPQDIYTIDDMIKEEFSSNHPIVSWIEKAREHVHFTGLPARIGWLGYGERSRLGLTGQRGGGERQDFRPDRLHPRSSRFRLGRHAAPRNREHARRLRRHRRLADAQCALELRLGRRPGRNSRARRPRRQRRRHHRRRRQSGDRGEAQARARRRSGHRRSAPCRCRL